MSIKLERLRSLTDVERKKTIVLETQLIHETVLNGSSSVGTKDQQWGIVINRF